MIEWHVNIEKKFDDHFKIDQYILDGEILRYTEPYIPKITGNLIKSGIENTIIGNGEIVWDPIGLDIPDYFTPGVHYAKHVYYDSKPPGRPTGALRGKLWFERMKEDKKDLLIANTRKAFRDIQYFVNREDSNALFRKRLSNRMTLRINFVMKRGIRNVYKSPY